MLKDGIIGGFMGWCKLIAVTLFLSFALLAEPVLIVSPDLNYLKSLKVAKPLNKNGIFVIEVDVMRPGEFGGLVELILFSRPFETSVKMFWQKDQNDPLKHLVFGNINTTTLAWSDLLPTGNKDNQLYHVHGHYNFNSHTPEEEINQRVRKTGQRLLEHLKEKNAVRKWFSEGEFSLFTDLKDGPHKPGSFGIYIKNDHVALEQALMFLINNNGLKEPYFIHAVTEIEPHIPGPNLKDHTQYIVIIGATPPEEGGVDWKTQFLDDFLDQIWADPLRNERSKQARKEEEKKQSETTKSKKSFSFSRFFSF